MPSRRVAAIVLPRLLCEIAATRGAAPSGRRRPFGVVVAREAQGQDPAGERARLEAVDERARRLGLSAGLTIAQARAYVASLEVRVVREREIGEALGRVAEAAMALAPRVGLAPPDAVVADVTGVAHLSGGEQALADRLAACAERLGHLVRVAVADGPRIAAMVAREGAARVALVPEGGGAGGVRSLPVMALPIEVETAGWLLRVGVLTVGDLGRLAREQVASRLGPRAPEVLALVDGLDPAPIAAYEPPRRLCEEASWEEPIEGVQGLVFVLRRLVARLAARLEGRGEATRALVLTLRCDRSIARLRGAGEVLELRMDSPAPIVHAEDLERTVRARLERCEIGAPAVGMALEAPLVTRAPRVQLDLGRDATVSPDALPVLLAEVAAEIGPERVGTLRLGRAHRPEARSALRPVLSTSAPPCPAPVAPGEPGGPSLGWHTTRLLPAAAPIGGARLEVGQLVLLGATPPFELRGVRLDARLDALEWWTGSPLRRDYARVWLAGARGDGATAWVYVDRELGESYLHGWLE
jgi:protein ImuB